MRDPIRIAIVGAPGYTGAELASILASHPAAELVGLFGSDRRAATDAAAETMADLFPRLAGVVDLPVRAGDAASILACAPDAVFLATPHEASERLAPALLEAGVVVFDLSAAFRLRDASLYPRHYGFEHAHAPLLGEAVYGLPELAGDALR
ncbi:MAG: Gfo/Idh/MocA family oxidoreductase, partial [Phycisphaerales bacterium]